MKIFCEVSILFIFQAKKLLNIIKMGFLIDKPLYRPKREYRSCCIKVQIFWEGHKNLKKLPGQIDWEIVSNFCGLLRTLLEQIKKNLDKYSDYGIPICRETKLNTHSTSLELTDIFLRKKPDSPKQFLGLQDSLLAVKKVVTANSHHFGHLFLFLVCAVFVGVHSRLILKHISSNNSVSRNN